MSETETKIKTDERTDKQRLSELLLEALSGTSARSRPTILREALKIVERMR
jgi:hypothetical protein